MKTTIDPARRLELYIRKARNGSKTFVFTDSSGADYDISSFDFELFIKKNAGARKDVISLLTSYAGFGLTISGNELTATFTDVITDIDAGEYYWELLRLDTNKTWLCGPCYVHEGEFDGVGTDTSTISIADTTTVTVSITDGSSSWGSITGTLSNQSDLNTALSGKQATLVSGTNIKTVNSTSLLGSGDVSVQATLVSGTNIKTVNGNSLLGSGDLTISGGGVSGLTATRVPYAQDATTLVDSANFTWDNTNAALTVNGVRLAKGNGTVANSSLYIGNGAGNFTTLSTSRGRNIAIGTSALSSIIDGTAVYESSHIVAIGYQAMQNATRACQMVAIGDSAGKSTTTGLNNVYIGYNVGNAATTAYSNCGVGAAVFSSASFNANENAAFGPSCLQNLQTGTRNVAIGACLQAITTGNYNVALGWENFERLTTQTGNTGIGHNAGVYNRGAQNTALGYFALGQLTTDNASVVASYNTVLGAVAGRYLVNGDYNTWIGYDTGTAGVGEVYSNTIAIGNAAKVTETNSCVIGGTIDANRNNYGFGGEGYGGGRGVMYIKNATTNASSAGANGIIIHAKDSSTGTANSTLALYLEEAPEATATFTQTHRLKVWINGTEYYLSLDAV